MYAAWQAGVWKAISPHTQLDLIVGASAGAWIGWAIAGGATPEELARDWLHPSLTTIRVLRPAALHQKARELHERFHPRVPFGLTVVETPRFRERLVRDSQITWRHLAATSSIPGAFPPVRIDGRFYVDGGLRGPLPLWAAAEMGATRVIALNCLNGMASRLLRAFWRGRTPSGPLSVQMICPSEHLGSLRDSVCWTQAKIERWLELGERDGKAVIARLSK
jgi:predicted acylesterase/phospholipase RssA